MARKGRLRLWAALALVAVAAFAAACDTSSRDNVLLATGTTVQDSGLLDALGPAFEDATGYDLKVIPVGTGQALEMGRRGDVDVVLTHDPMAEEAFVAEGAGVNRQPVMHNDFIIVGPAGDPAGLRRAEDALTAYHGLRKSEAGFVSRGDSSGTNLLELRLWAELGFDPSGEEWYAVAGQGMAATLQIASQRQVYTMTDRGTFLALRDTLDLEIAFEGDPALLNVYHVTQVNPQRHSDVNADGAEAFVDFIVSEEGQAIIRDFGADEFGEPLFIPDVCFEESELGIC